LSKSAEKKVTGSLGETTDVATGEWRDTLKPWIEHWYNFDSGQIGRQLFSARTGLLWQNLQVIEHSFRALVSVRFSSLQKTS
jgi:hypothetical protein